MKRTLKSFTVCMCKITELKHDTNSVWSFFLISYFKIPLKSAFEMNDMKTSNWSN